MRGLFLIDRGERPKLMHESLVWHPVIICCKRSVAKFEVGNTEDARSLWSKPFEIAMAHGGWLLERWKGFDIDYGHTVHSFKLFDGTSTGFHHKESSPETWALLNGAVWWSTKRLPEWLASQGIILPADEFSLKTIARLESY